jgi:glutamate formiminotransferase
MLIECVPNVSEGRRSDVIAAMVEAVGRIPGVRLLDHSSDPSHNRSVFTLVGDSTGVADAVLALFERAVAAIDLRTHTGEHPRLGAVDVVPFIPIEGATMADCVALARRVGAEVAQRFGVPVYLYEEASTNPARKNLEDIRRGEFEGLAARMATADWAPDFGPAAPHPSAGASVVGARMPLIAFNVQLESADVSAARTIARSIRESSGGLPCVKALGLTLAHRGVAQVSMNLTDYTRTSIQQVFDAIERQADALGLRIRDSELIGLIPAAALEGTSAAQLKLRDFSTSQILEERIAQRMAGR